MVCSGCEEEVDEVCGECRCCLACCECEGEEEDDD